MSSSKAPAWAWAPMMKGAHSTSAIPSLNARLTTVDAEKNEGSGKTKSTSVCSGLDKKVTLSSKKGSLGSRPSSIPRLIPLSNSQKKGYLLRKILTRNIQELPGNGDGCRPSSEPIETHSDGKAAKRPRLTHGTVKFTKMPPRESPKAVQRSEKREEDATVRGGSEIQSGYEIYTNRLRRQIAMFFGTESGEPIMLEPIRPDSDCYDSMQTTIAPYAFEIFTEELKNEARYYKLTPTKDMENQFSKRIDTVNWIRRTGTSLKLLPQTLHLSVYIVDAYLRLQNVPVYSVELFAAAALFIAAKQEETDCTLTAEDILKYCSRTLSFTRKRLITMESRILMKLKFKICCPTAQFFMEACASQMTYCDKHAQTFCRELAEHLLLHSLWEPDMMFAPNSKKARLALYYAAKYISYNYDLLRLVHGKDNNIWDKFRAKCFPEYKAAVLIGTVLPSRLSSLKFSPYKSKPSPVLKDITNKTCRQLDARTSVYSNRPRDNRVK